MNKQEAEDLYIRSLDEILQPGEAMQLRLELEKNAAWVMEFEQHHDLRKLLATDQPTFGPWFAARIMNKIQSAGLTIDLQLFGMFKRFQLAAIGIVVALLILNVVLAEDRNWKSVLGLQSETPAEVIDAAAPFDFSETLNKLL